MSANTTKELVQIQNDELVNFCLGLQSEIQANRGLSKVRVILPKDDNVQTIEIYYNSERSGESTRQTISLCLTRMRLVQVSSEDRKICVKQKASKALLDSLVEVGSTVDKKLLLSITPNQKPRYGGSKTYIYLSTNDLEEDVLQDLANTVFLLAFPDPDLRPTDEKLAEMSEIKHATLRMTFEQPINALYVWKRLLNWGVRSYYGGMDEPDSVFVNLGLPDGLPEDHVPSYMSHLFERENAIA